MVLSRKKGQVAMEYLLLVTVLLLVLLAALTGDNGPLKSGIENYVNELGESVSDVIKDDG